MDGRGWSIGKALAGIDRMMQAAMPEQVRPTPGPWRTSREDMNSYALSESGEWEHVVYIYRPDGHRIPVFGERAREDARVIVSAVNAVRALAVHLGRDPLEVAEGLDLVTMMRQRDEARREAERLRERLDALAAHFEAEASFAYGGWQQEKDDYLEGAYRALNRAAEEVRILAERGGEGAPDARTP